MKKTITVILLFILLTAAITFPLFFKVTTHIPGFSSTDEPFYALWDSWRIKSSIINNLPLDNSSFIAHPFGLKFYSGGYLSYLWMAWHHFLSLLTNPALTYNIQVISNILLSGVFVYLLVFYISKSTLCAIFSGIIFAFCPYQFVRIWQHLGLTYNQWIPLILSAAILLKETGSLKRKSLFFTSLFLALSFDFTIMYFAVISLFLYSIFIFFYNWRIKFLKQPKLFKADLGYLNKMILLSTIVFIILLPQFFPIIKNRFSLAKTTASAHNPYHRPFEDLFSQSARPLSYFLPAISHPIFGKFTENFIGTPLYGDSFTEHTLYLGWIPLGLAFVAVRRWKKNKKESQSHSFDFAQGRQVTKSQDQKKEDFYIGFFIFLAVAAWLFSQPPWWQIGPVKIYMPSFFMYKVLPMYRAYCRFGIVVMLAVAVLAGFGLKFILERFKSQKTKIALVTLFCGLVLFEFWNWPPYKVIDVSKAPEVYGWLKGQPGDFVIAEFPLDADSPNEMYKFYQTKHEKKIINGTIPGTYANKVAQTIVSLSEPETASNLKWMGVKYVLVHEQEYLNTELSEKKEELNKIPRNKGLKLVQTFPPQDCPQKDIMCVQKTGQIDIYEVISPPIEPKFEKPL